MKLIVLAITVIITALLSKALLGLSFNRGWIENEKSVVVVPFLSGVITFILSIMFVWIANRQIAHWISLGFITVGVALPLLALTFNNVPNCLGISALLAIPLLLSGGLIMGFGFANSRNR